VTNLPNDSALKNDQHEQCEKTVVPILVKAPESDAKYLEDKEGRGGVLSEEGCEGWDRNVKFILSIELFQSIQVNRSNS
jgi:hypothetical protein